MPINRADIYYIGLLRSKTLIFPFLARSDQRFPRYGPLNFGRKACGLHYSNDHNSGYFLGIIRHPWVHGPMSMKFEGPFL